MERISFKDFKEDVLKDPEVKKEYDNLTHTYELRRKLISMRKEAGLTQDELAKKLHTKKSNISRLESINTKNSPKLSTIEDYAHAIGFDVEINFVRTAN